MISRLTPRAVSAGVFACFCLLAASDSAAAASQYTPTEYSIGVPYPADVAVTYNGRRSAVRSSISNGATSTPYANGITLWDLTTVTAPAAQLAAFSASGEGTTFGLRGYQPSDRIELTNTRGLAIGSGFSAFAGLWQDTTYIDLFDASPSPAMIATFAIGPASASAPLYDAAGYANDVVITRDGAYALVNSDNFVHIVDIGNGTIKAFGL
jgi:hypothetical protein